MRFGGMRFAGLGFGGEILGDAEVDVI